MATGGSIPLLFLEGVPRLPGEPQDEASLTREVETYILCYSTNGSAGKEFTCNAGDRRLGFDP